MTKPKRVPVFKTYRDMTNYNADIFSNHLLDNVHTLNIIMATDDVDKQVKFLIMYLTHA